jgi:integrase
MERGSYLLRGQWEGASLSNMTFLMLLRRLEVEATAHGFRSSFRDWAAAETGFSSEVCEQALGHEVKDKTEAAYRRGDLFELRRDPMAAWAVSSDDQEPSADTCLPALTGSGRGAIVFGW